MSAGRRSTPGAGGGSARSAAASASSEPSLPGSALRFCSAAGTGPAGTVSGSGDTDRADGQVALRVLEGGDGGAELGVEPLDPVEGGADMGHLLLDQQHLAAELGVLLAQRRVLGRGGQEGQVVDAGDQGEDGQADPDPAELLQPRPGDPELAHGLAVVGDHDDREDLGLGRFSHSEWGSNGDERSRAGAGAPAQRWLQNGTGSRPRQRVSMKVRDLPRPSGVTRKWPQAPSPPPAVITSGWP